MNTPGYFRNLARRMRLACITILGLCALTVGPLAVAGMYPVEPGEIPTLKADEGLLLVALDSSAWLQAVYMRKDGALLTSAVLRKVPAGHTFSLVRVPAGRYGWHSIRIADALRFELTDDPEFYFEVRPGAITYGGDLVYRPYSFTRASIHTANHGLAAMDWLESEHPLLYTQYPVTYSGHYVDPFPAFYRKVRQELGEKGKKHSEWLEPPDPGALPLSPETLWQNDRVRTVALNPDGDLLAIQTRTDGKESWAVDLIDLVAGESQRVARTDIAFESIEWSGSGNLLLSMMANKLRGNPLDDKGSEQVVTIVHVSREASGKRKIEGLSLPRRGRILDVLTDDSDHILFATLGVSGDLHVHKVDISSQKSLRHFNPEMQKPLNLDGQGESWWFADGAGRLRVAFSHDKQDLVMSIPEGRKLTEILRLNEDSDFMPVMLSYDGNTIYALTDKDREQRDLVEFGIAARRITRTVFSKPGTDIVAPIFDGRRNPIGVRYYEGGRLLGDYFERHDRHLAAVMQKAFPGLSVAVIDKSSDARQLILWVEGGDTTPKIYHLDTAQGRAELIEDTMPWLSSMQLAPSQRVTATSRDGLSIEAFLTLPKGKGKRPLVIMPHGGPVGVSDTLRFDRDTQFLASLGYAVLRVNYRGSDGFGKLFRQAGYGKFGTAIEDDIDAALNAVLANHPLDTSRMCVVGFSYGGYSALISAARWPDRFRCVVSVAGVSDRILFYTASDGGRTAEGRASLEKVLGDPKSQEEEMIATSPLYRFRDIRVPVMLAHGLEDQRVDFEHARRMQRMLDLDGRPPVGLVFEGEGHGFESLDNINKLWTGIAGFLKSHLTTPDVARETTAASAH
jgi:dipeptidyl aminopeptidase/acylaminoacyl peptidase